MLKEVIQSGLAPGVRGDYSQAWAVTGAKLIFVSGQVAVDMDGNPVGVGDIALQMRTVCEKKGGCWRVLAAACEMWSSVAQHQLAEAYSVSDLAPR